MAETSALDAVQGELSTAHFPFPADFLSDVSPQAAIEFGRQVAGILLQMVTDAAALIAKEDGDDQPTVNEALNGVAMMVAGATHALVALGVLPVEAEEALAGG
jgi:hypothetical protein